MPTIPGFVHEALVLLWRHEPAARPDGFQPADGLSIARWVATDR